MPFTSIPKLALHNASLPMLRGISIDISPWVNEPTTERVMIQDAPLLREAHLPPLPLVNIDLPWPQITTLTLPRNLNIMECILLLRRCRDLVNLTVHTLGPAAPNTTVLTLHSLESLTCSLTEPSILDFWLFPALSG
ncbi:hypothetical protein B0H19DRAFT_1272568 [Mycena capillaripes]|nr:hypothetical protein B0H19DRAFT_1272441 [Mycena capillaripes]KAJ6533171.1 hypothetical protein B0H19DRAFT_1272568 [Mycena capillaripes]